MRKHRSFVAMVHGTAKVVKDAETRLWRDGAVRACGRHASGPLPGTYVSMLLTSSGGASASADLHIVLETLEDDPDEASRAIGLGWLDEPPYERSDWVPYRATGGPE